MTRVHDLIGQTVHEERRDGARDPRLRRRIDELVADLLRRPAEEVAQRLGSVGEVRIGRGTVPDDEIRGAVERDDADDARGRAARRLARAVRGEEREVRAGRPANEHDPLRIDAVHRRVPAHVRERA